MTEKMRLTFPVYIRFHLPFFLPEAAVRRALASAAAISDAVFFLPPFFFPLAARTAAISFGFAGTSATVSSSISPSFFFLPPRERFFLPSPASSALAASSLTGALSSSTEANQTSQNQTETGQAPCCRGCQQQDCLAWLGEHDLVGHPSHSGDCRDRPFLSVFAPATRREIQTCKAYRDDRRGLELMG